MELYCTYGNQYLSEMLRAGCTNVLIKYSVVQKEIKKLNLGVEQYIKSKTPVELHDKLKIAIWYDEDVEIEKKRYPIYWHYEPQSKFYDLLEAGHKLIFVAGYSKISRNAGEGKRWLNWCVTKAAANDAEIHVMGLYSFGPILHFDIASADVKFNVLSDCKRILLPNGKLVGLKEIDMYRKWINAVSYSTNKVGESWESNTEFNIASALYCIKNFRKNDDFELPKKDASEYKKFLLLNPPKGNPNVGVQASSARLALDKLKNDGLMCDECPKKDCDIKIEGSVCGKQNAFKALSKLFNTRDADIIADSLAQLLEFQGQRYATGRRLEQSAKAIFDDVTKIENSLFKNATQLYKILRPESGVPIPANANPQQIASKLVKELKDSGDILRVIEEGDISGPVSPKQAPAKESS